MKKYIYPLAITVTLLSTTACSDDEVNAVDQPVPDSQKEMISFSLSDGAASTRAGFTGSATSIAMRIQSDEKGSSPLNSKYTRTLATAAVDETKTDVSFSSVSFAGDAYTRYWDDAFGRKAQLSVYAVAIPNGAATLTNPVSGDGAKTLENLLSKGDESNTWGANATNTIAWQVTSTNQTKDAATATTPSSTIDKEDLVYSNNIQANTSLGKNGVYWYDFTNSAWKPNEDGTGDATHGDGQMLFRQPAGADVSAPGKFDKGHLVFNHALTRLSVTLKKDASFGATSAFAFIEETQITLYSMPVSGTFDIAAGTWNSGATTGDITGMAKTSTETTAAGTYMAQMLPGYTFTKDDNTNVMDFTIDNNTYYITKGMIYKALNDNAGTGTGKNGLDASATSYTMEQGKNYSIEINVQKAAITNVTATLVKWNDIEGSLDIDNSHITITTQLFEDASGANPDKYDENHSLTNHYLLRHEQVATLTTTEPAADTYVDYSGKYGDATTAVQMTGSTTKWTAKDWYFNDNLTAYHIRSINDKAYGTSGANVTTPSSGTDPDSYFSMSNGPQNSTDYHWGAPMKSGATLEYSTSTGFSSSLYQGILSTKSDINITEFHMMSNIDVIITTPAVPAATNNSVVLYDNTKSNKGCIVEFVDVLTKATVDMGTGLVTASDRATAAVSLTKPDETSESSYYTTAKIKTKAFSYAFVPQSLTNGTGTDVKDVSVKITTPDGNTYYVQSLKSICVGTSTTPIDKWLPNHHYVYTFNLTKTGIENITATLVKWEDVVAGSTNIDLEK